MPEMNRFVGEKSPIRRRGSSVVVAEEEELVVDNVVGGDGAAAAVVVDNDGDDVVRAFDSRFSDSGCWIFSTMPWPIFLMDSGVVRLV